jgi:hypothetical protein
MSSPSRGRGATTLSAMTTNATERGHDASPSCSPCLEQRRAGRSLVAVVQALVS